ncbi:MAG: pentapeptide repeat-containing protein [Thermodesulfobacteriota bacterium]|nr:pentapeptide repeat-containing protein [Thermodesulfobacteriota bacterium]
MSLNIFIVLFAVVAFGSVIIIPKWQSRKVTNIKERIELENKLRATLAQMLGAAILLCGLFFTWEELKDTRNFSNETLRISEQGQITERFSQAIEHLGSDKLTVRLGGICALERIANDSSKDHWQVMEVLTAYVRENAPFKAKRKQFSQTNEVSGQKIEESGEPPALDIQTILTVLGRRKWQGREGEDQRLDLTNTDLRNINLEHANLSNANFRGANLMNASLSGSNLKKAELRFANLKKADLSKANLEGVDLFGANLNEAYLTDANLNNANLVSAYLIGAYLTGASLKKASLLKANLEKAVLASADMEYAKLMRANLKKATLTGANLEGANLSGANLEGANLSEANLEGSVLGQYLLLPKGLSQDFVKGFREATGDLGANLAKADMSSANLTGAHLRSANLKGANLEKASLAGADLVKANLKEAKNLSIDQLCQAATLFEAELDPELEKSIQEACPLVMREPKPDELKPHKAFEEIDKAFEEVDDAIERKWENH